MTKMALRFVDAAGFVDLKLQRTVDMTFKRSYKYLIAFIKVFLKYLLISYYLRAEILKWFYCVVRIKSGLPDHCIFEAKSSLVKSSKQRKQKPSTKKNKEHF